jgi:uncharacterized membrane protein
LQNCLFFFTPGQEVVISVIHVKGLSSTLLSKFELG